MTIDLEKSFFDTFGIEPREYCERIYQDGCFKNCPLYPVRKTDECFKYIEAYPEISDHILLELICILNDSGASYLSYRFKRNINGLKQEILSDSIFSLIGETNANKEKLRHQVQELFKEQWWKLKKLEIN